MAKKERQLVSCERCGNATLHQSASDPVIAHCKYSRYGEVAAKLRVCRLFTEAGKPLPVERREKTYGLQ